MQHKRVPRNIEFFDEHGTPISYQIQHEVNSNITYNYFYPIKYKRGRYEKTLRLKNDGADFTFKSVLDEFPINSAQQASDCFRMGRFINQFRRICGPETPTSASANASNTDYSSINSLGSAEDDQAHHDSHHDNSFHIGDDSEDDNIVCDISNQADKPRLCQDKQAHELVVGKRDKPLAKKQLTFSKAPHLDTKSLNQKIDEVAQAVDADVSTILAEQMKDPVLGTVRSWIRTNAPPDNNLPEIQQSKGILPKIQ